MASSGSQIRLLRGLIRELRLSYSQGPVKNSAQYAYIMDQFRDHQVTSRKICKDEKEMEYLGQTYLCLLESVRKHEVLSVLYRGKGERSIEQSAALVGLRLPKLPDTSAVPPFKPDNLH